MANARRDAACLYAWRGWSVLPLRPRSKQPDHRLVPHGKNDSTTDLGTIFRWWREAPRDNVGINCAASGIVVLDIDPRHDGDETMHGLEKDLGALPTTVEAHTGGGGRHIIFRHPGVPLRGSLGDGIDIKDSGYIVAPPSTHPTGKTYGWSVDGDPEDAEAVPLPPAWLDRMERKSIAERHTLNGEPDDWLRRVPARIYVPRLTGHAVNERGWVTCPWHKGGMERTPSFKVDGTLWSCFVCEPEDGQQTLGGNIYALAARMEGLKQPLHPVTFAELRGLLVEVFA